MPLIEYTLEGKRDKVKTAIERIKSLEPISNGLMDEPYFVAYSGGKDSDALRILFELSGVPFDLVHNHTTVDAPETVRYVRSIPGIQIQYPELSMWALIVKKLMPPTRIVRYCCTALKEVGGKGRFVATGVRWAESVRRKKNRSSLEIERPKARDKIVLNADNAESRRMFELCTVQGKRILNPIIDWSDAEVWELLHYYGCRSNPLYECGYKRIGCIGCPMARSKERIRQLSLYPKYQENYIRAFGRMLIRRAELGRNAGATWNTGQDVFDWWIKDPEKKQGSDGLQMTIADYMQQEEYHVAGV
jgi:phosphoadenosine phosphosulfate reductase